MKGIRLQRMRPIGWPTARWFRQTTEDINTIQKMTPTEQETLTKGRAWRL